MMDGQDRRVTDQAEGAYALAILYTIGYLGMMAMLMLHDIPENNREILLTLVGIMSAAQLGIIKYYYDGSKSADKVQTANIARSIKSEAVVQEIAKAVPLATVAPVAAVAAVAPTAAVAEVAAVAPVAQP